MKIQPLRKTRDMSDFLVASCNDPVSIVSKEKNSLTKYRVVNRGIHCIVTISKRSFAVS